MREVQVDAAVLRKTEVVSQKLLWVIANKINECRDFFNPLFDLVPPVFIVMAAGPIEVMLLLSILVLHKGGCPVMVV